MNTPREWPTEDAPNLRDRSITLIVKMGANLAWACNTSEKTRLLEESRGPVWAVWPGQWTTHLFNVPRRLAEEELRVVRPRRRIKVG